MGEANSLGHEIAKKRAAIRVPVTHRSMPVPPDKISDHPAGNKRGGDISHDVADIMGPDIDTGNQAGRQRRTIAPCGYER